MDYRLNAQPETQIGMSKAVAYRSDATNTSRIPPSSHVPRFSSSQYQNGDTMALGYRPPATPFLQPVTLRPTDPTPHRPSGRRRSSSHPSRKQVPALTAFNAPVALAYLGPSANPASNMGPLQAQYAYPNGYPMPTGPTPALVQPPLYGLVDEKSWFLEIYAKRHEITSRALRRKLHARNRLPLEAQLHDVIVGSLVPLTRQHRAHNTEKIVQQAVSFFTSFDTDAQWHVHVENLPRSSGRVINGLTANSRNSDIGFRFMRFRFPYITFEWFLQTSYSDFVEGITFDGVVEVEFHWKAWSRTGAASGLVAYGTIIDTIKLVNNEGPSNLVITTRHFIVTQVFQPELMTPESYPQGLPEPSQQGDVMLFTTSWTVIQFLRSSQIRMGFLIAISALFSALQPIVGNFSAVAGWIFSAIGVISGLISVIAVMFGWFLTKVEANAARRRQDFDSH